MVKISSVVCGCAGRSFAQGSLGVLIKHSLRIRIIRLTVIIVVNIVMMVIIRMIATLVIIIIIIIIIIS